ncbi:MAG: FxsA family protein, partial [Acidimicrobiales bacterium]
AVAGRFLGLIAGVLIGFPGFVTTAVGAVLLIPPVRKAVEPRLAARASSWSVPFINRSGSLHDARRPGRRGPSGDGTIIDVDLVDRAHPDGRNAGDVADVPRSARPELG